MYTQNGRTCTCVPCSRARTLRVSDVHIMYTYRFHLYCVQKIRVENNNDEVYVRQSLRDKERERERGREGERKRERLFSFVCIIINILYYIYIVNALYVPYTYINITRHI